MTNYIKYISIFITLVIVCNFAYSAHEEFNNRLLLSSNGYISSSDDKLGIMLSSEESEWDFVNTRSYGKVSLGFDKGNLAWVPSLMSLPATIEVPVQISGIKYNYETGNAESFFYNKVLSLEIDENGAIVKESSSFVVEGAHKIIAVTAANMSDLPILNFVYVETEVAVHRYYEFEAGIEFTIAYDQASLPENLVLTWDNVTGAEGYQLEYTFVHSYGATPGWVEKRMFKNNSTRVETALNQYTIPNVYENGYIIYRVRAFGKKQVGSEFYDFYTDWSSEDNTEAGYYNTFEWDMQAVQEVNSDNFNKQIVVAFAEDGKTKHSVNYYDGSMRNRQSQVKINSEDVVMVGETKYDYLGRPALTILPAPKDDASLTYSPLFNANTTAGEYTAANFDVNIAPQVLSTSTGASYYYSPDYALATEDQFAQYLPNAGGSPFVRTIFTKDNTGRVKIQGGVGSTFQPSSTGVQHTTRYEYASVFQEELDRLFGAEIGYEQFYKKDMVIDPNGQSSITISDMKGNVIATALAGDKPSNMLAVNPENPEHSLQINLLNNAANLTDYEAGTIVMQRQFFSDHTQSVTVDYLLNGEEFSYEKCSTNFCIDCVYDVEIKITDENGNPVPVNGPGVTMSFADNFPEIAPEDIENESYLIDGTSCQSYENTSEAHWNGEASNLGTVVLGTGTYYIEKRITLREDVLDAYADSYISRLSIGNRCLNFDTIVNTFLSQIDTTWCDMTCEECHAHLSSLDPEFYTTAEISALYARCEMLCHIMTNPICATAYDAMLADVSPDGQYGQIRETPGLVDGVPVETSSTQVTPSIFPLSVFNENNALPMDGSYYRNWRRPQNNAYYDEWGNEDFVSVECINGSCTPAVVSGVVPPNYTGTWSIKPHQLANVVDFLDIWQDSWAKSLVIHHPEYQSYLVCQSLQQSHDFDMYLISNDEYLQWFDNSYSFTISNFYSDPTAYDPLFTNASAWPFDIDIADAEEQLELMMANYTHDGTNAVSIWQASYVATECGNFNCGCNYSGIGQSIQNDAHWNTFKMMYYSLKSRLIDYLSTQQAIADFYYNGCISPPPAWGSQHGFFASGQIANIAQPCHYSKIALYTDKTPRFPTLAHSIGNDYDAQSSTLCYNEDQWAQLTSCPAGAQNQIDNLENYADLYFYDQCDQCPVERDLQGFLASLVTTANWTTLADVDLNCEMIAYTPDLDQAMTGGSSYHNIMDIDNTTDPQVVEFDFSLNSVSECNMILQIEDALNPTDVSYYSISDITEFCCLYDYEGSFLIDPSLTQYGNLNDFTIIANVVVDELDTDFYDEENPEKTREIVVYGAISCIDFDGCEFNSVCRRNEAGDEMLNILGLLNSLYDFNMTTPVDLDNPIFINLYHALHEYTNTDTEDFTWEFTSSFSSNSLELVFSPNPVQQNVQPIVLEFDLSSIAGHTIVDVVDLMPATANPDIMQISILSEYQDEPFVNSFSSINQFVSMGTCSNSQLPPNEGLYQQEDTYSDLSDFGQQVYDQMCELVADPDNWTCIYQSHSAECSLCQTIDDVEYNITVNIGACPLGFTIGTFEIQDVLDYSICENQGVANLSGSIDGSAAPCKGPFTFDAEIRFGDVLKPNSTCNATEIHNLKDYLNNYLDNNGVILDEMQITDITTENCSVYFYKAQGEFTGGIYEENQTYDLDQIVEIEDIIAYNGHAYHNQLLNRIDFEVYVKLDDNSHQKLYAITDCFEPECWCKKDIAVTRGDFSVIENYRTQGSQYDPTYFATNLKDLSLFKIYSFETTTSHSFNGQTFENNNDAYLAFDFEPYVDADAMLWANAFVVEPFTEYEFSCNLFYVGSTPLKVDLREFTSCESEPLLSLFNERGGYISHYDNPENTLIIVEPNINGTYINFNEVVGSTTMDMIELRGTFNSGFRTNAKIGIYMETEQGERYYLAMDNVKLKKQEICPCQNLNLPVFDTIPSITCCEMLNETETFRAEQYYNDLVQQYQDEFKNQYRQHCLANIYEEFTLNMSILEDQYTLYYYDLAGNLIRTVPPKGVQTVNLDTYQAAINADKLDENSHSFLTSHTMSTVYKYNSLGQLTAQYMPDHEQFDPNGSGDYENYSMKFWYDRLGRIVASQNSKQYNSTSTVGTVYSYTLYDELGRVTESGVIDFVNDNIESYFITGTEYINYDDFYDDVSLSTNKTEVTKTEYDSPSAVEIDNFSQDNLRNRVSWTSIDEDGNGTYEFATFYSYDIHGNVKSLVHRIVELADIGQQYKRIDYEYDLISGNVKKVSYQAGEPDQFHHRYWYDADNRITHVETSDDNINWQQDAKYFYYKHGPLARVELGNDKVQALDYAYTLQGWLKGVNSDNLATANDIGKDGYVNTTQINPNQFVGNDQFGFSLGYYPGDYTPVGGTSAQFLSNMASSTFETAQVGLYNGNISYMVNSSRHVNDQSDVISMGFAYQYDQLNRLRNMVSYEGLTHSTNSWSGSDVQKASSSYTYDKNGNLKSLNRNNRSSAPFDLFTYNLVDNDNNNKLLSVTDAHTDPLTESTDIDNLAGPYTYDQIGNLISDPSEDIANIAWTASGKVRSVTRTTGLNDSDLYFKYDPTGNRIVKMVERENLNIGSTEYFNKYYYICDAQGNIMAVYYKKFWYNSGGMVPDSYTYKLIERPIYGSSRIANNTEEIELVMYNGNQNPDPVNIEQPEILSHTNGYKHFELTNHLGNVMAVVSDKRTPIITGSAITGYTPELLIAKDYYPFGMEMSGRYTGVGNEDPDNKYRFGFNGKEKDDEWNGQTGAIYDYGFRIYDARIGKFLSVDPLTASYPWYTPYQFAGNKPIVAIDLDGLEELIFHSEFQDKFGYLIKVTSSNSEYLKLQMEAISNPDKASSIKIHFKLKEMNNDENSVTRASTKLLTHDVVDVYNLGNDILTKSSTDEVRDELYQYYEGNLADLKQEYVEKYGIDFDAVVLQAEDGVEHIYVYMNSTLNIDDFQGQFEAMRAFYHEIVEHLKEYLNEGTTDEVQQHKKAAGYDENIQSFTYEEQIIMESGYTDYESNVGGTTRTKYCNEVFNALHKELSTDK